MRLIFSIYFFLLLLFLSFLSLNAQTSKAWLLVFEDNFNGTDVNKDLWNIRGNIDNIEYNNGLLTLLATKNSPGNYSTGSLYSHRKFKYGEYEIKFKITNTKGTWPNFWMYGWGGEEIDWYEMKGHEPYQLESTLHWYHADKSHIPSLHYVYYTIKNFFWTIPQHNISNHFHTFVGTWDSNLDFMTWSLEGNQYFYCFRGQEVTALNKYYNTDAENYLIPRTDFSKDLRIGLAIWDGKNAPDEDTEFPGKHIVDYVRVWKELKCNEDRTFDNNYTHNIHDSENIITGRTVTFGGNGWTVLLREDQWGFENYMDVYATNEIVFKDGAHIKGEFNGTALPSTLCDLLSGKTAKSAYVTDTFYTYYDTLLSQGDTFITKKQVGIPPSDTINKNNEAQVKEPPERKRMLDEFNNSIQAYPIPINDFAKIELSLKYSSNVTLSIYNSIGKEIAVLTDNKQLKEGKYNFEFNASMLPPGIYYYYITAIPQDVSNKTFQQSGKMVKVE